MSADRVRDGHRIAQLLASELESGATPHALSVTDTDPDVEPTPEGALAFRVRDDAGEEIAVVYVQPDRARVEFRAVPGSVADVAGEQGLRVRPTGSEPPRTIVFVADGAQVKWVLPAFQVAIEGE
ncbi:MAG: hypothetical protein ACOCSD_08300 [Halolamina sp.]